MSARHALPDPKLQPVEFMPSSMAQESVKRACAAASTDGYWRGYEARGWDNLRAGFAWGLMAGAFLVLGAYGAGYRF